PLRPAPRPRRPNPPGRHLLRRRPRRRPGHCSPRPGRYSDTQLPLRLAHHRRRPQRGSFQPRRPSPLEYEARPRPCPRRLPQNSTFRVLAQSPTELYLAGTNLTDANRHEIFLEALDPQTLAVRRSFSYEGSPATSLFALRWRSTGDLILAWRSSRASTRIAAIDPTSGLFQWNTPLAESDEILAVALLPGNGMAVFANSFDASGAPIAFLQRLSASGQLLEAPLRIGSHVQFARADASGLLEWIGLSTQRGFLRTSTLAAHRCRPASATPAQPLYYSRMPFSQGEQDYASYFPLAAASTLPAGVLEAFPLIRQSNSLAPIPLPLPLAEPSPACLEDDADNYAVSSLRSRPAPA
ncbi:hypothetical protein WDZ92_43140, partial [Nostoc sp. NIES-2111]